MNERTLATPLSGEEVITSILAKVRTILERDCYLSPMCAYEGVSGEIRVAIRARDVGRIVEVEAKIPVAIGEPDEDAALVAADAMFEEQNPNEVRMEAQLPIPTLVDDGGKKEIKKIQYKTRLTGTPHDAPKVERFEDEI